MNIMCLYKFNVRDRGEWSTVTLVQIILGENLLKYTNSVENYTKNCTKNPDCFLHFISTEFRQEKDREKSAHFKRQTILNKSHTLKPELWQKNCFENTAKLI